LETKYSYFYFSSFSS